MIGVRQRGVNLKSCNIRFVVGILALEVEVEVEVVEFVFVLVL